VTCTYFQEVKTGFFTYYKNGEKKPKISTHRMILHNHKHISEIIAVLTIIVLISSVTTIALTSEQQSYAKKNHLQASTGSSSGDKSGKDSSGKGTPILPPPCPDGSNPVKGKCPPLPGSLTFLSVITNVMNNGGGIGTKKPSDFTITVSGNNPSPSSFSGSSSGTSVTKVR
jgi:hypothetical protein